MTGTNSQPIACTVGARLDYLRRSGAEGGVGGSRLSHTDQHAADLAVLDRIEQQRLQEAGDPQ